jgi:hypothetical protein
MAEICFEALAWKMSQRDECLLLPLAVLEQIALHLGVAAAVVVFIAKATQHLRCGMPLLGRRCLVVQKDLVDDSVEGTEFWCETIPSRWTSLGMLEHLPDGVTGVVEFPGDLLDKLTVAAWPPNGAVVVHAKHFLASVRVSDSMQERSLYRRRLVLQRRLSRPTSHAAPSQLGEAPLAMGGGGLVIPPPPPVGPP